MWIKLKSGRLLNLNSLCQIQRIDYIDEEPHYRIQLWTQWDDYVEMYYDNNKDRDAVYVQMEKKLERNMQLIHESGK